MITRHKRVALALVTVVLAAGVLFGQTPLTNIMNLGGVTDTNGYLMLSNNVAGTTGPLTPIGNLRGRTDSNGYLLVSVGATTVNGIATTSTDGTTIQNTTASTAGVPVQMSPRTKWCGTAYNSVSTLSETDCLFIEVLPATVAGTTTATFKVGYINDAGTVTYPLTVTSAGALVSAGSITSTASGVQAQSGATIGWNNITKLFSNTDKLLVIRDVAAATGAEINVGSATLGTCTGGTITTGSHNFAGGYTGNTSSSCVVNFGTPSWTNAPFCVAMSIASTTHPRISAVSTSSMTVTGGVSGEAITYHCSGRIGT